MLIKVDVAKKTTVVIYKNNGQFGAASTLSNSKQELNNANSLVDKYVKKMYKMSFRNCQRKVP